MGDKFRRHCACIFESTSGPPIQWCSHHAQLRKEIERLTAEGSEKDLLIGRLTGALEGIQTLSHGGDSQVYQAAGMALDWVKPVSGAQATAFDQDVETKVTDCADSKQCEHRGDVTEFRSGVVTCDECGTQLGVTGGDMHTAEDRQCEHSRKKGGALYRVCKKCGVHHSQEALMNDSHRESGQ